MRPRARIREVGLRDGLQLVKTFVLTETKIDWCRKAAAAGVDEIEVTSFVPSSVVPQFADAAEVAKAALTIPNLTVAALVPNTKGALRAFELGVGKVNYVVSASEAHNQSNVRRTIQASLDDFRTIVAERDAGKLKTKVVGGIATSFGCTIQGKVPEAQVLRMVDFMTSAGADELILADTVGYANPAQVRNLFEQALAIFKGPVYAHFHDTRGLGLANVTAALDVGVVNFDTSIGGLGGCPFAPGASGNIDTEDCAFLLESMGYATGINIEALIAWRGEVAQALPSERVGGMVAQAGLPKNFNCNEN